MLAKLSRSSVYGRPARGFGTPGCAGNPETIDNVAFPSVAPGTERVPPPLYAAVPGAAAARFPAEATIVAAVPPPEGIAFAGVRTARLQVCSMGAKVKSPLSFEPMTMRPWTRYGPEPASSEPFGLKARVSGWSRTCRRGRLTSCASSARSRRPASCTRA